MTVVCSCWATVRSSSRILTSLSKDLLIAKSVGMTGEVWHGLEHHAAQEVAQSKVHDNTMLDGNNMPIIDGMLGPDGERLMLADKKALEDSSTVSTCILLFSFLRLFSGVRDSY